MSILRVLAGCAICVTALLALYALRFFKFINTGSYFVVVFTMLTLHVPRVIIGPFDVFFHFVEDGIIEHMHIVMKWTDKLIDYLN